MLSDILLNTGYWGAVSMFVKPLAKPIVPISGSTLLQTVIILVMNAVIILASCHYLQNLLLINHDLRSEWHAISNWILLPELLQSRIHQKHISHCNKWLTSSAIKSDKSTHTVSHIAPLQILSKAEFHHTHRHSKMPASSVLQVSDCVMKRGVWVIQPSYYYLTMRYRDGKRFGSITEKKQGEPARDLLQGCQSLKWSHIHDSLYANSNSSVYLPAVMMYYICSTPSDSKSLVSNRPIKALLVI